MKKLITLGLALSFSVVACKKDSKESTPAPTPATEEAAPAEATTAEATPTPAPEAPAPKSLLETAKEAGNFTTLLAAVETAGLQDTLSGAGPFTIFAPTDEAFAKLPKKDLEALLKDKAKLTDVLTYHVVAGNKMAADVGASKELVTVEGASVAVDTTAGVKVGGAMVTTTDITASNGTIHVIDTVMMPPKATKKKKK